MYYPIGWPVQVDLIGLEKIRRICCDRVKILFAILTDDSLAIYYTNVSTHFAFSFIRSFFFNHSFILYVSHAQPCVPIVISKRTPESLNKHGPNYIVEWKPDSNMLVVAVCRSKQLHANPILI